MSLELTLAEYLKQQQSRVDSEINRLVPPETAAPITIHRAMRYSLMAGGKRIRPVLCLEAAAAGGGANEATLAVACSLEFIHTYSLIHDDLPSLDNDDFRRGKPTCHKVFGEAMAILAGDSLLTLAFQVLSDLPALPPKRKVRIIAELARASGTVGGMIGGQVADIEGEGQPPNAELLDSIHRAKTGALLRASVRMGAICADASESDLELLTKYGEHVGLAFQIVDDILDVEESSEALGKTAGKDADQGKITFPAVYGLDVSRTMAQAECAAAKEAVAKFGGRAGRLREIADMIVSRKAWKQRLDLVLVARGLAESREKAQALIMAGDVMVAGQKAAKPGQTVDAEAAITVAAAPRYVSRGGFKLEAALERFAVIPAGLVCADIGASTGGFTDCLLQHGALRVYAIDVGTNQLDWRLRIDPRVRSQEHRNARELTPADVGELVELLVCDVSFISVTLILPALKPLLTPTGRMIILVKPQFEVGKGQVGKGGIVRDPELHNQACERVNSAVQAAGFETALMPSPILGTEGNREFLLYAHH